MCHANFGNQSLPVNGVMPCLDCKSPCRSQAQVEKVSLATTIDGTGSPNGTDRQRVRERISLQLDISHAGAEQHGCVLCLVLVCPYLADAGCHDSEQQYILFGKRQLGNKNSI